MRRIFFIFLAGYVNCSVASDKFIIKLNQDLRATNADEVSRNLSRRWDEDMVPFLKKTAQCEPGYVESIAKLLGTVNASALQAYGETLESAMMKCPRRVLAHIDKENVPIACSVGSILDEHSKKQLQTQISRVQRIKDADLAFKVRVCVDAYSRVLPLMD
jgi:hypothetical protein